MGAEETVGAGCKGWCGQGQEMAPSWREGGPQDPTLSEEPPAFVALTPLGEGPGAGVTFKLTCEERANVSSMRC